MAQAVRHAILTLSFTAGADLSAKRYTAVKADTTAWQVVAAGAGDAGLGILQNEPTSGKAAEVDMVGATRWKVDGNAAAIAPGDFLKSDTNGKGVKTTTDNDQVMARALEASSADGDIITVILLGSGAHRY